MYKVFIDNGSISFQKAFHYSTSLEERYLPSLSHRDFEDFRKSFNTVGEKKNIWFYSPNPYPALRSFFKDFTWIEAAGGIVRNSISNKSLFILRNDMWDIPKGKIEDGETPEIAAVREIQEECGLNDVRIIQELSPTYHVYHAYDNYWIKKTYWYLLETEENETKPQLEEGITKVEWLNDKELSRVKDNTYASIIEVIEEMEVNLL